VRQATDDNPIQHMHSECWITETTHTKPEYVIINAFPQRQWLGERTSVLRYNVHCLSCYSINNSRSMSVHITTRLRAALLSNGDAIARSDVKFFTSPNGLHCVWSPVSLCPMCTLGCLCQKQSGLGVNLTAHLHQVPKVKNVWICASTPSYYFKTLFY
jgi:hypothetical protein